MIGGGNVHLEPHLRSVLSKNWPHLVARIFSKVLFLDSTGLEYTYKEVSLSFFAESIRMTDMTLHCVRKKLAHIDSVTQTKNFCTIFLNVRPRNPSSEKPLAKLVFFWPCASLHRSAQQRLARDASERERESSIVVVEWAA